jgi:hypothetical protein
MSKSKTRERKQQRQSAARSRNYILWGIIAATIVIVAAIILIVGNNQLPDVNLAEVPDESVTFPLLGQEHIPVGSPRPNYNSNPPTSGPHYASPLRAGVYPQQPPDENLVHNLEHGHIWLSYRDADDTETIDTLTTIQSQFPLWVVVSHRPQNDDRLVAAAWGRMLPMEEPDTDTILAFITRHRNRAPESVPG